MNINGVNSNTQEQALVNYDYNKEYNALHEFPEELIVEIFSKLDIIDLAQVSLVCKQFKRIGKDVLQKKAKQFEPLYLYLNAADEYFRANQGPSLFHEGVIELFDKHKIPASQRKLVHIFNSNLDRITYHVWSKVEHYCIYRKTDMRQLINDHYECRPMLVCPENGENYSLDLCVVKFEKERQHHQALRCFFTDLNKFDKKILKTLDFINS